MRAITNQQLSTKAAATIYRRLTELMPAGTPTPAGFAAVTDEQLRGAGYSRQKISYLRDLARHVQEHSSTSTLIESLGDEAVITQLTQIKGIGRWSAEMFLMFRLHRPDVLPVDDIGIVNAIHRQYRLRKRPTPGPHPEAGREVGSRTGRWRAGTCGEASTTSREPRERLRGLRPGPL